MKLIFFFYTICLILLNGCFHVHVDEDEDDERITVRSDEEMAAMFQAVSSLHISSILIKYTLVKSISYISHFLYKTGTKCSVKSLQ